MADRARLIQALEDADAAGDTEAAQAFADALRGMEGEKKPRQPTLVPLKRVAPGEGILGSSIDFTTPSIISEPIDAITSAMTDVRAGDFDAMKGSVSRAGVEVAAGATGTALAARGARPGIEAGSVAMNAMGPPAKKGAQAVTRAATSVIQPVIDRLDQTGAMGRILAKRLMQDNPGMTLEAAVAKAEADLAARGPQAVIADTGEAMSRLNRNLTQGPGETAQRAKDILGGRQAAEKTRMIESLRQNISDKDFYSAVSEAKAARKKSGPYFARAYAANQNVTSPKLEVMKADPIVKKAMEKGIALERMGATEAGEVFEPKTFGVVADFNEAGDAIIKQMDATPLALWHQTKRGIDTLLRPYRNQLTGKLDEGNPEVAALVGIRKSLDTELKNLTGGAKGDYAQGNRIASEAYKLEDALDAGRAFARGDEEITEKVFNALSLREKDAYRAGVAREMVSMIRKNTSDSTPAQIMAALKDEAGVRKKLRFVIKTDDQFNGLMKDIENNLRFRETNQKARGGSPTGSIAMEEGQLAADNFSAAGGIVSDAARGNLPGATAKAVQYIGTQLSRLQVPQSARDRLGEMLLSQDPKVQQRAFELIRGAGKNGWVYAP
jgi:hypothetical protein